MLDLPAERSDVLATELVARRTGVEVAVVTLPDAEGEMDVESGRRVQGGAASAGSSDLLRGSRNDFRTILVEQGSRGDEAGVRRREAHQNPSSSSSGTISCRTTSAQASSAACPTPIAARRSVTGPV